MYVPKQLKMYALMILEAKDDEEFRPSPVR